MTDFRYTFDGGAEKTVNCHASQYRLAALYAFAKERIERLPEVRMGSHDYDGHILKIWIEDLVPDYGPYFYGIGSNEAGSIVIVTLAHPPKQP